MFRKIKNKVLPFVLTSSMVGISLVNMTFTSYASDNVTLTFSDSGIVSSDESASGYVIDGTDLTINAAGTYIITGSCTDGNISVKKGTTGVNLILKNLSLEEADTAPLVIKKNAEVTLDIEGTVTLTDSENPDNENSEDEEIADAFEGAAIKVKSGSSLEITGNGTLNVDGSACKNGIKGAELSSITISGSTVNVNALNNGIADDNELNISGGVVNISCENDGLKAEIDEDDTESSGNINISGGNISLKTADKGINANGEINISGGTIDIVSESDAIHGDNNVNVTGGTISIDSGDDGIHAEYVVSLGVLNSTTGPEIEIKNSYEGIEGATVNLYSGKGTIVSSDDGINSANADITDYTYEMNICGGYWNVNAEGDGLDSNGNVSISGGEMLVFGASTTQDANTALDYDGSCTYSGGTFLAVGLSSGMGGTEPTSGDYIVFNGSTTSSSGSGSTINPGGNPGVNPGGNPGGNIGMPGGNPGGNSGMPGGNNNSSYIISAGDYVTIVDSEENIIYSFDAPKNATYVVFAMDGVSSSNTYYLRNDISKPAEEIIEEDETIDAPAFVTAKTIGTKAVLTWAEVEDATCYYVYKYWASSDTLSAPKVVTGNTTTYYNLTEGKTYRYLVRAVKNDGEVLSDYVNKNMVCVTVGSNSSANIPTSLAVSNSGSVNTLIWDAMDGVSTYYVYKYWTSSKTLSSPKEVSSTTCKYYNIESNSQYRYLVSTEKIDALTNYNGADTISISVY